MKKLRLSIYILLLLFSNLYSNKLSSSNNIIPSSYKSFKITHIKKVREDFSLELVRGNPTTNEKGIVFTFKNKKKQSKFKGGNLFYGLLNVNEQYSLPKYRLSTTINKDGKAFVNLKSLLFNNNDFVGFKKQKKATLCYRLSDKSGRILYEGRLFINNIDPFSIDNGSIIEGPFINNITPNSAVISFETLKPQIGVVKLSNKSEFKSKKSADHEIKITNLKENTLYMYSATSLDGDHSMSFSFKTAPKIGTKKPFTFAFASDSRKDISSGERDVFGINSYVMRRISALMNSRGAAFMQFSGDEISGYNDSYEKQKLEYINWKNSTLPYASHIPIYTAMGNHESLFHTVGEIQIDKFPFKTKSAEALFSQIFVNPNNGPISEDESVYDPNKTTMDFPPYKENVYYFIYANIAIITLNSDYWYSPSIKKNHGNLGGNPHGFIMDNQLKWLEETLNKLKQNSHVDHIFISIHSPIFPNGGHIDDSMFYKGKNEIRAYVANKKGKLVAYKQGIIERRDQFLKLLLDNYKVTAILTGHEHSYSRLEIKPDMPIYNNNHTPRKPLNITRTIYQINNGAAGSPYYAKGNTPWNGDFNEIRNKGKYLKYFTTQTALVLFHINGKEISLEVINPETLQQIEYINLTKEKND